MPNPTPSQAPDKAGVVERLSTERQLELFGSDLIDLLRREGRYSGIWFADSLLRAADHLERLALSPPPVVEEAGESQPVAWRWRYMYPEGNPAGNWIARQRPIAAAPPSEGFVGVEVEPLYAAPPVAPTPPAGGEAAKYPSPTDDVRANERLALEYATARRDWPVDDAALSAQLPPPNMGEELRERLARRLARLDMEGWGHESEEALQADLDTRWQEWGEYADAALGELHATPPASPGVAIPDETGWLIELPHSNGGPPSWWCGVTEHEPGIAPIYPVWSRDANCAVRFCRREDAERTSLTMAAQPYFSQIIITDHGWMQP